MSVEILSVSLSQESIEAVAQRVAQLLGQGQWPTTGSNPGSSQNPQDAAGPGSQQGGDPWMNGGGAPPQGQGQYQGQQNQGYQGQQGNGQRYQGGQQNQGQYQGGGQQQQGGHNCAHGQMIFQPAGVNRNTNEPYDAYYKCPLQRGAQGRCRNVYPGR